MLAVLVVQLVQTILTFAGVSASITSMVIGLAAGRLLESDANSLGSPAVPPPAVTTS